MVFALCMRQMGIEGHSHVAVLSSVLREPSRFNAGQVVFLSPSILMAVTTMSHPSRASHQY